MIKYFQELLREHFSFSAKEKRGMLVLAGILFCLLAFREMVAHIEKGQPLVVQPDEWAAAVRYFEPTEENKRSRPEKAPFAGFYFDPNTITEVEMLGLGLSPKQAAAWQRFRNAGAVFRKAEDVKKLFFMDEERYALWEHWIKIERGTETERVNLPTTQNKEKKAFIPLLLNHCDSTELTRIRGIGPFTASKVLRYRSWLGGFVSHEQLTEIRGLRQEQIDTLIKYTTIDPASIEKIAINLATEEELKAHPYIRYKAGVLIRYRSQHGPYKQPGDLLSTGVMDEPLLMKLKPYLDFTP